MKILTRSVLVLFTLASHMGWAVPTPAKKWVANFDQSSGGVEFNAVGRPSALKIKGTGSAPRGRLETDGQVVSGKLSFDLDSLDTGIKLRNEHMKEKYLETQKYKEAVLTLEKFPLPPALKDDGSKADSVPFRGTLTLHGIDKPVSGTAKAERKGNLLSIAADFGLKISEFGIPNPGFAGITMAENVQVSVSANAPLVQKE